MTIQEFAEVIGRGGIGLIPIQEHGRTSEFKCIGYHDVKKVIIDLDESEQIINVHFTY